MPHDLERDSLARYLDDHNLRHTRQRDAILDVFLEAKGHITSEEIYQRAMEVDESWNERFVFITGFRVQGGTRDMVRESRVPVLFKPFEATQLEQWTKTLTGPGCLIA